MSKFNLLVILSALLICLSACNGGGFIRSCIGIAFAVFIPAVLLSVGASLWSVLKSRPIVLLSRQEDA